MKATKTLMVAALAAAGLGMADMAAAQAKHGGGHGARGHHGHHGHGHRHWHGHRHYWGPSWGWSIGAPLAIGAAWAWHDPYWYGPRVVYRDVIRDEGYVGSIRPLPGEEGIRYEGEARPEPQPMQPAPSAQPAPQSRGAAPTTGPLYMNYCESARAYYPKVTSCPEGWKFQTPSQ